MKLPLLLAGAGAVVAALLAHNSGLLRGAPQDAPAPTLVRVAERIDGVAVQARVQPSLGVARGAEGAFEPSYVLPEEDSGGGERVAERATLNLAVPDPFNGPFDSDGFGPDPLVGEFDPAMMAGLGLDGHMGKVEPSDVPLPEGTVLLTWEDLAMPDYEPPTPFAEDTYTKEEIFPAEILAHDGQVRAFEGFMQPIAWKGDKVTEFLLSPYPPGCCFGGMPGFDEWIDVEIQDPDGIEYHGMRTIRVTGTFAVGENYDDYGYVYSIFLVKADTVERLW